MFCPSGRRIGPSPGDGWAARRGPKPKRGVFYEAGLYSAFQYILHGQAPETNRCASRFALTPKKEILGHSGLAPALGGLGARKFRKKFVSDADNAPTPSETV